MTLSVRFRLGPCEILAPLGAGAMGEVYKARDTRLKRTVAIKVLPQHLSEAPGVRQHFEWGAKTISQLSHSRLPHLRHTDTQREPVKARECRTDAGFRISAL
jgi:eukaryotic-like serine/threonine-protein kinase